MEDIDTASMASYSHHEDIVTFTLKWLLIREVTERCSTNIEGDGIIQMKMHCRVRSKYFKL